MASDTKQLATIVASLTILFCSRLRDTAACLEYIAIQGPQFRVYILHVAEESPSKDLQPFCVR